MKRDTKAARKQAQRFRGFPLSWEVKPNAGWFRKCDRPTRRKRDRHGEMWIIMTDQADHMHWGASKRHFTVCLACCTFQQGKAIRWAMDHDGYAEAFR